MVLGGIKNTSGRMVVAVRNKFKRKRRRYSLNAQNTSKKDPASSAKKEKSECCLGHRHIVIILGFLNCFFLNGNRSLVSVTIVAMVKHKQLNETSHRNNSESSCPYSTISSKPIEGQTYQGDFDWDTKMQGYILGVVYGGYLFTQIPGGKLADAIGSKVLLVACNAIIGMLTIITPFAAWWNFYAMLVVLLLRSALQGFIFPVTYRMLTNWCPRNERGFLSTLVVCGFGVGVVVTGIINGWLCDVPHLGWPSAYYLWGLATLGLAAAFTSFLYEHPRNHPTITEAELKYIVDGQETDLSAKKPPTPWKKILLSPTSHAYFFGLFGYYWSIVYFLTVHPTFIGTVLHFSMTENGVSSCGPVLMKSIGGFVASILSNFLTKKNYVSVDKLRKGFTLFGAFGFASCMLGMSVAGCNAAISILFYSLSLFTSGLALSGIMISGMDMSPVHAGSFIGIAGTVAGTSSFIIPVLTGFLTTHETLSEWKHVFWISSAIVGLSGVVYVVFGSAEVQSWNYPDGKVPEQEVDVKGKQMVENKSTDA